MREETHKERQTRTLRENVAALMLVAEQALERGDTGKEFTTISRIDLFTAISAGKEAQSIIAVMRDKARDEAKNTCIICGRPGAAMQGIEHDGWCWGCVRNRIEGKGVDSYGKPFPSYPRPWAEEGGIETPVTIQEEYIPGYCQGCVRVDMDKLVYGQVFPAFKVVDSEHCDGCTEGESFAECPNNCAEWKGTPRPSTGEYCSCECHT